MAKHIGINPIKWSNDDFRDLGGDTPLETCLAEAREAGYEGIEVGHKMERNPEVLLPILNRHGLKLISGWHSSHILTQSLANEEAAFRKHLAFMKDMGCKVAIVAECSFRTYHDPKLKMQHNAGLGILSCESWMKLANGLDHLAQVAEDEGLTAVYHHHMGTVVQDEQQLDYIMENTKRIALAADTGHMAYGGMEPVVVFRRYLSRIRHVHLKDVRTDVVHWARSTNQTFEQAVKAGVFTVPGDGSIDFKTILAMLKDYNGWLVVEAEQDPKKANPLTYAKKGRAFLRSQGL